MAHNHEHVHEHGHLHNHTHNIQFDPSESGTPADKYLKKAFIVGITLNLAFVAIEAIAGWWLNSVALLSDAGHNLSDVVSLALALLAIKLATRKPSLRYTYGIKRSTILVSLVNALLLLAAIAVIIIESIEKLSNPQPVAGGAIAWVAAAGIVVNAFTAWMLMRHQEKDLNVKGAYLHMVADTLVSVGVLVSGVVISFTDWWIIDPIIGLGVAVMILFSTWGLLRDSMRLALDGVPADIDIAHVEDVIKSADNRVESVHHIHVWALSTAETALTAHIVVDKIDDGISELKHKIKSALAEYGISHATLEFEAPDEEATCEQCD
jgi:cobalt-zinc-cadmium efflux system protein